ncbi:hypothetical protein Y032_0508g2712 [Ancylostoma ceylanicum]|uniref:Uncharacterized protein n=1 Tax=Ancylostoma ceylanicum TaxID=53326 RepID=A0A016WTK6_9BILA|nr:hypothetical protein Y032_0508g2712 [Ancylostoma ceylanicum]
MEGENVSLVVVPSSRHQFLLSVVLLGLETEALSPGWPTAILKYQAGPGLFLSDAGQTPALFSGTGQASAHIYFGKSSLIGKPLKETDQVASLMPGRPRRALRPYR